VEHGEVDLVLDPHQVPGAVENRTTFVVKESSSWYGKSHTAPAGASVTIGPTDRLRWAGVDADAEPAITPAPRSSGEKRPDHSPGGGALVTHGVLRSLDFTSERK
jgi:hypothetical protein